VKIAESLKVWLQTPFEGGRHQNRVAKITAIEKNG
jgi:ribose 5-phosphate isomerase RpiB